MRRKKRALTLTIALAAGVSAQALIARSNFPNVGIVFAGAGKQPKSTDLEMLVGEDVSGSSAVCWVYTREGRAKATASVRGEVEILHQSDPDEILTLQSGLDYRPGFDDSIACGCGTMVDPLVVGDTIRGEFDLKKVGRLKKNQSASLQLWAFDGVAIPGGQLTDCGQFFP